MKKLLALLLAVCSLISLEPAYAQKFLGKTGTQAWDAVLKRVMPSKTKPTLIVKTHRLTPVPFSRPFAVADMSANRAWVFSRAMLTETQVNKRLLHSPQLYPFEKYVRHFVFTVSARGVKNPFKGSGFVFAEHKGTETVLWGISAAHVVRHMGKDVNVTFYADGKEYTFPAEVVLTGRKFGLNAALIKLPPEVARVALPVVPAKDLPKKDAPLFTFGFSAGTYKKTLRRTIHAGSDRIVANFPSYNQPRPGFCGSLVLNDRGEAVGIEVGGYSPKEDNLDWYRHRQDLKKMPKDDLSRISEIVPISRARFLVKEYRQPGSAPQIMLFNGIRVGQLAPDEFVESVGVRYQDGSLVKLLRNPFMSLWELHAHFRLENAVQAEIIINHNRTHTYGYAINLKERSVTRIDPL